MVHLAKAAFITVAAPMGDLVPQMDVFVLQDGLEWTALYRKVCLPFRMTLMIIENTTNGMHSIGALDIILQSNNLYE